MLNCDRRDRVEGFLEQLVDMRAGVSACLFCSPRGTLRFRQRCYEASACALDSLVGGLGADAEQLADLGSRPSLGVVEYERDPIRRRELTQSSPQHALILCGGEHCRGIFHVRNQAVELLRGAHREVSAATVRVDYSPRQDAAQPRTGGVWFVDLSASLPCALKRVLQGVLGVVFLAGETARQRQQRWQLAFDAGLEATVSAWALAA